MTKAVIQGHGFQHMLDRDPDLTILSITSTPPTARNLNRLTARNRHPVDIPPFKT